MLLQDLRYALRQLRRAPGFSFTVALTLALSVGVATAVFCVVDAVILRPLPFAQPDKIVAVESNSQSGYEQPASWPSYQDERAQSHGFAALAGYSNYSKITLDTPSSGPVSLVNVRGTDNFFQVFGVQPLLGRTFLPGEEKEGRNDITVLSFEVWQKDFSGNRGVLNQPVKLGGHTYTVVGVMPAGFRFPLSTRNAVYTPMHLDQSWMHGRGNHWLQTIGRVKDGFSTPQAQADLTQVFANMARANSEDQGRTVHLESISDSVIGETRGPLWTLFAAVLAVLAIGCVNIAGLLLARGVRRQREMAMRVAIGASRSRLLAQVLTEGLLLALIGAAGGVLLAAAMLDGMRAFLITALARGADIQMNWTVLAAAVALAVVASLGASVYPAIHMTGIDPNRALKAGGNTGTERGQHRLRSGFVIAQVALTLVLLVVSSMLIGVVTHLLHTDLGFDPAHILALHIDLSRDRYEGRDMETAFYGPLEERVKAMPGVQAAGLIDLLPIQTWGSNSDIHIAGQPPYPTNQIMLAEGRIVSAGYFNVMGIQLHGGRNLSPSIDRSDSVAPNVVVNDAFVSKFIPKGLDPTAQRMDDNPKEVDWTRIVGVTGNVRQNIFHAPLAERDWLMDEIAPKARGDNFSSMYLLVRSSGDPHSIIAPLRTAVHDLDPTVPFGEPETMADVVSETPAFQRMEGWLFGIFAALALALALVGLYGLISHEVEQGTRDIGVRMALGATRGGILGMVLSRVAIMLAAGAATGLVLTFIARKVIGMVIYVDAGKQAGSFALTALALIAAGLLAALIPAARAASIEPVRALRAE